MGIFYRYVVRPLSKVVKIAKYLPVLWKDEDWDIDYLLYLIDYKLKRMHICLDKNNIVVREELDKMLSTINETKEHICNYVNSSEVYEEKVEKPPVNLDFRFEKLEENGNGHIVWMNADTRSDLTDEEDKAYLDWLKRVQEYENQEWNNIWDTIKEHGRSWWD